MDKSNFRRPERLRDQADLGGADRRKTGYVNFWKYINRTYLDLLKGSVTLRDFLPGGHAEVDWAGQKVRWVDGTGKIEKAI
ncbi:MAG: hypothetical protein ACYCT9_13415 [Leptospirillum sp.]